MLKGDVKGEKTALCEISEHDENSEMDHGALLF
jgi:hypothetical protein